MSGHSKWATIHRAKEVKDAKKGAAFTKLGVAITMAVRQGGGVGDPDKNFRLRLAMEKARQFNMPKENVQRAIDKATGGGDGAALDEVLFEGFGPSGVAVLVSAVTDNKLRTAQKVREVLDKNGGSMGGSGAVSYLFSQVGELLVKFKSSSTPDDQELEIMDLSGVSDIERGDEGFVVYTDKDQTFGVKARLEELGYTVESAELSMRPTTSLSVDTEAQQRLEQIVERLEDLDDVQKVWTNNQYA